MATQSVLPVIIPLLRRPVVEQAIGFSRTTLYRYIERGLFPKPVKIGGDRVAWPANEVQLLNQARISGKTEEQIRELVKQLHKARTAQ
jgi:prophage regulatory protein